MVLGNERTGMPVEIVEVIKSIDKYHMIIIINLKANGLLR
jgi:hypothetical protein